MGRSHHPRRIHRPARAFLNSRGRAPPPLQHRHRPLSLLERRPLRARGPAAKPDHLFLQSHHLPAHPRLARHPHRHPLAARHPHRWNLGAQASVPGSPTRLDPTADLPCARAQAAPPHRQRPRPETPRPDPTHRIGAYGSAVDCVVHSPSIWASIAILFLLAQDFELGAIDDAQAFLVDQIDDATVSKLA